MTNEVREILLKMCEQFEASMVELEKALENKPVAELRNLVGHQDNPDGNVEEN